MQAVIARDQQTGNVRYAGTRLMGQAKENEELLLLELSEIEVMLTKRFPDTFKMICYGNGDSTVYKIEFDIEAGPIKNYLQEMRNNMGEEQFLDKTKVIKSFSKRTVQDV